MARTFSNFARVWWLPDQVNAHYCSHYAVAMEIVRMQMSCIWKTKIPYFSPIKRYLLHYTEYNGCMYI